MSNLDLWDRVKTPEIKYTKKVNMRGGFTATSPQYLIKLATKEFGSYGKGFGLSESEFDYSLLEAYRVAIHNAKFFYCVDGERYEFVITNTVEIVTKNGFVDTDFAKKAETNTLCKALSKIGFAADIYMGMFEDQEYIHNLASEQAINNAADKDTERAKQAADLTAEGNRTIEAINKANSLSELKGLYSSIARKLANRDDKLLIKITKAKDAAKERIENDSTVSTD